FLEIPGASHVSVLFSGAAMRASQNWAAQVLRLAPTEVLPSHRPLFGALAGFVGILLIAGPFLREVAGKTMGTEVVVTGAVIGVPRLFLEIVAGLILSTLHLCFCIRLYSIAYCEAVCFLAF